MTVLSVLMLQSCGEGAVEPKSVENIPLFYPQMPFEKPYKIDINSDGIPDYEFTYQILCTADVPSSGCTFQVMLHPSKFKNGFLLYSPRKGYSPYDSGAVISTNPNDSSEWSYYGCNISNIGFGMPAIGDTTWYGTWAGITRKYLPLKFSIKDSLHLGWLCMSVDKHSGKLTVHDYAYQPISNENIVAGYKP